MIHAHSVDVEPRNLQRLLQKCVRPKNALEVLLPTQPRAPQPPRVLVAVATGPVARHRPLAGRVRPARVPRVLAAGARSGSARGGAARPGGVRRVTIVAHAHIERNLMIQAAFIIWLG